MVKKSIVLLGVIFLLIVGNIFIFGGFLGTTFQPNDVSFSLVNGNFRSDLPIANGQMVIGDYAIILSKETVTHKFNDGSLTRTCNANLRIVFQGQEIFNKPFKTQEDPSRAGYLRYWTFNPNFANDIRGVAFGNFIFDTNIGQSLRFQSCRGTRATFVYFPKEDLFIINTTSPQPSYIQGEDAIIQMEIINNFVNNVNVNLQLEVCQPTFIGRFCETFGEQRTLDLGENTFTLPPIPTTFVTDRLEVISHLSLAYPSGFFSGGGLSDCGGEVRPVSTCMNEFNNKISHMGTWTGEQYRVLINPLPIYINQSIGCDDITIFCPNSYSCQIESGLCIRTDIIENILGCQQVGCPIIPGNEYVCTSSGVCAETIFIPGSCTDEGIDCPSGFICDPTSGACLEETIYNILTFCESPSDCYAPCQGIGISCIQNTCTYQGECNIESITCADVGCPSGFVCDTNRGVCESTTPTTSGIPFGIVITFVVILIVAIVGGLILLRR